MEIVKFEDIRDQFISNMNRNMIIPVLGSGFSRGCTSKSGCVPSGADYRAYMLAEIKNKLSDLSDKRKGELDNYSFSQVSSLYNEVIPAPERKHYITKNFTDVYIEEYKKKFLSLPWTYIYTLNIDDAIEKNSNYKCVIEPNHHIEQSIFDNNLCVVKLHGDANEMAKYGDYDDEIFAQLQYINSIRKNENLLDMLKHDSIYQNLLFIGCSLDDEIDLLSALGNETDNITARYCCVTKCPDSLDKIKYESYGITHCILFESFEKIYEDIYSAGIEAGKIRKDDLDKYKKFTINRLSDLYEDNKSYLLYGKGLIDKDHVINIPYFFISREKTESIISGLNKYPLQILVGSGLSGKSFLLADIACSVRDKDVFLFEAKDSLSDNAFRELNEKHNCVILIDSQALNYKQIEDILVNAEHAKNRNVSIVLAANKNNRELFGILTRLEELNELKRKHIRHIEISNKLNKNELQKLNPLLTTLTFGIFKEDDTIVDNLIKISESIAEKHKYQNVTLSFDTYRHIAALIALATETKIYSTKAVTLDLIHELEMQRKQSKNLIDFEATWSFERSSKDNSPSKYIVNAPFWLCRQLAVFARKRQHYEIIVEAYKHIITELIRKEGYPDLYYSSSHASYKNYILFDNINKIFFLGEYNGASGLSLIRDIYESLYKLLSTDPNYMHQRAKCYIKSSYYEYNDDRKIEYLNKAYRDANVALQIFEQRFESGGNDKLCISIDHIKYTKSLILCHKCNVGQYQDVTENTEAILTLCDALSATYNTYAFAKNDSYNYHNVIDEMIFTVNKNTNLILDVAHSALETLLEMIMAEHNQGRFHLKTTE